MWFLAITGGVFGEAALREAARLRRHDPEAYQGLVGQGHVREDEALGPGDSVPRARHHG